MSAGGFRARGKRKSHGPFALSATPPVSASDQEIGLPEARCSACTTSALTSAFACEAYMSTSSRFTASSDLPRMLFVEQLSTLIGKTATTIRTCATNDKYKHLIPKPFKLPHSRRLCWYEHEVLAWIESNRPAEPPPPKRPRGRPTKVEQLARARWANPQTANSAAGAIK